MKYIYLRCPDCLRLLAVGPRFTRADVMEPDGDYEWDHCWMCHFEGTMTWRTCGGEGKRETFYEQMEHEWMDYERALNPEL